MTSPFVESSDELREILSTVSVPLLAASLVHMAGTLDVLKRAPPVKPPAIPGDSSGQVLPADGAAFREFALSVIEAYRHDGYPAPFIPSEVQTAEILNYILGGTVDPEYLELLTEEVALDGDARRTRWSNGTAPPNRDSMSVLIIGAGMSGLLLGYRLKELGIQFSIIEKNRGVGGTWHENRYPGCRVDVPSDLYSYSFVPNFRWPNLYSPQTALRHYFESFASDNGLNDHIHFETEVMALTYDERLCDWQVKLKHRDEATTTRARVVVSAVGQLNRPAIPPILGADTFRGPRFHSARWPENLDLAGQRIAVIGVAATAVQLVPELAAISKSLVVFQRTPNWIIIHPEYRRSVTASEKWAHEHLPFFTRWRRAQLFNPMRDRSADHLKMDPNWPQDGRSISQSNEALRVQFTAGIKDALKDRPDLFERVLPTYPPYTKRPNVGDGGYYRALQLPHVQLVDSSIREITPSGLVDDKGINYEVDAIVYATGFESLKFLAPMNVKGLQGRDLHDFWGDEPRAYLGMTVTGFPNLFCMYGPGTNLGFNGNLIFNSELQARYISKCLVYMVENDVRALDVREPVYREYAERLEVALRDFSWSHPSTGSWYRNAAGKVISNSPWKLLEYWEWTRNPNINDYTSVRS